MAMRHALLAVAASCLHQCTPGTAVKLAATACEDPTVDLERCTLATADEAGGSLDDCLATGKRIKGRTHARTPAHGEGGSVQMIMILACVPRVTCHASCSRALAPLAALCGVAHRALLCAHGVYQGKPCASACQRHRA